MSRTLIICESPNKAKKLQQYLGSAVTVKASFGHIADLPTRDYGVNLATLEERYEIRNAKVVGELKQRLASGGFERVLLASDPDREGEAIAWHLARALKLDPREPLRIEFREITKAAVEAAVRAPRPVDLRRVNAQRARRVLDRIVGFDCSKEICWPAGAQSAGRCQTPALHILCEREREILAFVSRTYYTLEATYLEGISAFVPDDGKGEGEEAGADGAPAEESGETRERRGKLVPKQYATREEADAVRAEAGRHPHIVRGTETSRTERRPEQPYTTSTLQQDASRKLRLSAKATMDRAQALFEAGAITYHRTDSTRLSDDAVQMARDFIAREHPESLPDSPNRARAKAGAQDAHEAIRPTQLGPGVTLPPDTGPLYEMIRARFLASQCKPALFDRTRITIDAGPTTWVAEGSVLVEPGFLVYWGPYARQEDVVLPAVAAGQQLTVEKLETLEKKTNPPPRYDQGALIKKLERSGIGRPATFAGIIDTLLKRDYVREMTAGRGKKVLQPTDLGMKLDGLMTAVFPALVTEEYTAEMERNLDEIEQGERSRLDYLRPWYEAFRAQMGTAVALGPAYRAEHQLAASRPRGATGEETTVTCDRCGGASYRKIARKGKKGSFLACPACGMTRDVRAKVKPGACRRCGAALIEKKIRGSVFFGCVRYGADEKPCDYRESADGAALGAGGGSGRYARAATDKSCPKCGKHKLVTLTPVGEGGTAFYACEDRACRFTLPLGAKRRRDPCPACGGVVLERRRKPTPAQQRAGETGAPFWACARWPACKFASDFTPSA